MTNHDGGAYAILEADTDKAEGYVKFSLKGNDRVAIPAVRRLNAGIIHLPHIASTPDWWTGIAFVNTEDDAAVVKLTAYAGDGRPVAVKTPELAAHAKNSESRGRHF